MNSAPAGPPTTTQVRCTSCKRLLAELATPPYRITCPRCKEINQQPLDKGSPRDASRGGPLDKRPPRVVG